ncbi:hypothetical protein F5Y07DRAFT_404675 [Xylaria sp. FL0933]|nr:hypothetical protein F5Y07DRAFT_404675 [Xylaria sp. FL0933]
MSVHWKGNFRRALPASGMKYQSTSRLMHSNRRDKRVTDALKAAGYEITRAAITEVLAHMFQIATPIVTSARAENEDLWDVLPLVQSQLDWAHKLPEPIFFELFVCLIEARHKWEKEPEFPYERYELYNKAVLELIEFRKSTGDYGANSGSWILTDSTLFDLARGLDSDEDEDEDVEMGDTNLNQETCQQEDRQEYECEEKDSEDENFDEEYLEEEYLQEEDGDPMVADVVPPMAQMKIDANTNHPFPSACPPGSSFS